nr:hypothetical protein [Tanacetum cinerariifolium]
MGTRGSSLCHVDEGSQAFIVSDNDLGCLAGLVVNDVQTGNINSRKRVMSSDSHATITYTSMSSYEVIVNGPEAPPSPDYIPGPEAPASPDYIPGPKYLVYLPPADDVLPAKEQPLSAAVSPTAESPGYITDLEPEMEPEEDNGDDEKSEGDSIEYPTSRGDDDADDDGDDLSEDDADEEDEEDVGNKMHNAFPLPVIEFPLAEEVPTTSEESSHC